MADPRRLLRAQCHSHHQGETVGGNVERVRCAANARAGWGADQSLAKKVINSSLSDISRDSPRNRSSQYCRTPP